MARVELRNLCKTFDGGVKAVDSMNLIINDQEFVVLVGPSGCGKTTTLRMIAGLEAITAGELYIGEALVNDLAPKDRDIAMVFQNYALYPHMTVFENMAFALRNRKVAAAEIERRVRAAAAILNIDGLLQRKPRALSGGQRQRVALGRAIVRNPKVFLFDEPLSNLDAKLRVQMRAELSELRQQLDATMIYVTHDQIEAMTMGDRIVVMKDGRIHQSGPPLYLYQRPINKFVAGFIGTPPMNFFTVRLVEEGGELRVHEGDFTISVARQHEPYLRPYLGKEVVFGIRPEDLHHRADAQPDGAIPAKITVVEPLGAEIHLYAETAHHALVARVPPEHRFRTREMLELTPNMENGHYFDPDTEMSLLPVQWEEPA